MTWQAGLPTESASGKRYQTESDHELGFKRCGEQHRRPGRRPPEPYWGCGGQRRAYGARETGSGRQKNRGTSAEERRRVVLVCPGGRGEDGYGSSLSVSQLKHTDLGAGLSFSGDREPNWSIWSRGPATPIVPRTKSTGVIPDGQDNDLKLLAGAGYSRQLPGYQEAHPIRDHGTPDRRPGLPVQQVGNGSMSGAGRGYRWGSAVANRSQWWSWVKSTVRTPPGPGASSMPVPSPAGGIEGQCGRPGPLGSPVCRKLIQ